MNISNVEEKYTFKSYVHIDRSFILANIIQPPRIFIFFKSIRFIDNNLRSNMANIRSLTPALQATAEQELNESKYRIPEDLLAFKNWVLKQPHLKARTDDQFLISFLRGCKYSLEKAKTKLDSFYAMRCVLPELYNNRSLDNPKTLEILRTG